jgi:hypothetical protein
VADVTSPRGTAIVCVPPGWGTSLGAAVDGVWTFAVDPLGTR